MAVRGGRIKLAVHEAAGGTARPGGHTIARHVGKTEAELRARIAATANMRRPPPAVSSFTKLGRAETFISRALQADKARITQWAGNAQNTRNLVINYDAGSKVVGTGIVRASGQYVKMTKLRVVLKKQAYNGMPHYILTAFPTP